MYSAELKGIAMRIPLLVASLLLLCATHAVDESDLPVYLRGIGWRNVEAELMKDLLLSPFVRPILYDIYMNVSVRGYDNAEKSSYEGKIKISLNITAPVNEIELHSLGLDIKIATLIVRNSKGEELADVNNNFFVINCQRETLVIPSRIVIQPGDSAMLMIEYNGTARMNGRGFYESWNDHENSSELPYISLLTDSEPADARRWFPCFDEPDKKAQYHITIGHPVKTKAYSNTQITSTSTMNGRAETSFEMTVPLPTYLVAIAITEQPMEELTVDGNKFRAIGYDRKLAVRTAADGLKILQNHSIFDGVPFIPQKTDILVVEDFSGAMENPGLITFHMHHANDIKFHVHELAHMYFGNLVTLSTWDDIWSSQLGDRSSSFSLYDFPMHLNRTYISSFYHNSFGAQDRIHYNRASQVLRMVRKFVGGDVFDRAIKKYLLENAYGNGDATKVIKSLLNEYDGDIVQLERMLAEWIYQPGVAVLFMERNESGVQLSQTRFHSSYFNEELRDNHTRFTIPLFCKVDGESRTIVFDSHVDILTIPLPANSTFTIEDDYGELFGVWAQYEEEPEDLDSWLLLSWNLVRSELISHERFANAITPFAQDSTVQEFLRKCISEDGQENAETWDRDLECQSRGILDAPLTEVFPFYLRESDLDLIFCSNETTDRQLTKALLRDKIINDELKIRSNELRQFITKVEHSHPGATMEFVYEELEKDHASLFLRLKMNSIIKTAGKNDMSTLHQFIRTHPSIIAESYDTVAMMLEDQYLKEEYAKRNDALVEMIKEILDGVPATDPTDEMANSITADIPKKIERRAIRRI